MKCKVCGEEIHPKRLEILPGTETCVKHSTTERYKCMTVQYGEGDHTYNDIVTLNEKDAWNFEQSEKNLRKNIEIEENSEIEEILPDDLDDEKFIENIASNIEVLEDKKDTSEDEFLPNDPYLE